MFTLSQLLKEIVWHDYDTYVNDTKTSVRLVCPFRST